MEALPHHSWLDRLIVKAMVIVLREQLRKANRPGRIRLDHVTVRELTEPPKELPMPVQTLAIDISGDAPFGYLVEGITYERRDGQPMNPAPDPSGIDGTSSDPGTSITALSGGRAWIQVDDASPVGTVAVLTLSFVAGTSTDDAVITVTYVADRPGAVNLAGVTVTEATAAPV